MRKIYTLFVIITASLITTCEVSFAAKIYLVQNPGISITEGLTGYDVFLDTEGEDINALSGSILFDKRILDIYGVDTSNSVVSEWLTAPSQSKEVYFDTQGRISFEGVIVGGFKGTVSPYYKGSKPGKLFTVTFRPKGEGEVSFGFENILFKLNDGFGTDATTVTEPLSVYIPPIPRLQKAKDKTTFQNQEIYSDTLTAAISQDELVDNTKWFVYFNEDVTRHSVSHYEIAETSEYNPRDVASYAWHKATSPYILENQNLDSFIHIKAVYDNGNYSYTTLLPVDNKRTKDQKIVIIIMLMAFLSLIVLVREERERAVKKHK